MVRDRNKIVMSGESYFQGKHRDGEKNHFEGLSVRVSIPTVPKRIRFLLELITSLNSQTFLNFDIALIVPKGSSNLYASIASDVPLKVIEQNDYGMMDAIKMTVRSSMNYDINVNLDDDSIIGKDHVEKYLETFSMTDNVGMIFGTDDDHIPGIHGNLEKFLKFNYLINRRPLIKALEKYSVYFNSAGILSGRTSYGPGTTTLLGLGTNMAWVPEALKGAHLPLLNCNSLGILNEQYLALQSVLNGFKVIVGPIDSTPRKETRGASLSSDRSIKGYDRRLLELYTSPIFVNGITEVNTAELKRTISRMKLVPFRGDVRLGIRILGFALESIESELKEEEVVKEIERLWENQILEIKS